MISALKSVSVRKRTFTVDDFNGACADTQNVNVSGDMLSDGCGFERTDYPVSDQVKVKGLFQSNGVFYIVDEENGFYECTTSGLVLVKRLEGDFKNVCALPIGGSLQTFVYGSGGGFVVGGDTATNGATAACFHKGRLYTALGRTVTVGEPFDFENNCVNFNVCGTVGVNASAGDVVGLFSLGNALYVICVNAIYKLTPSAAIEDFVFERLSYRIHGVQSSSFAASGALCTFVSAGLPCVFDGSSVKRLSSICSVNDFTIGRAEFDGDNYILPLKNANGECFLYRHNVVDGRECLIPVSNAAVASGGYTVNGGAVVKITESAYPTGRTRSYATHAIYLDDCSETTLCDVRAHVSTDCTLSVHGDFGAKKYSLKKGCNSFAVNHKSRAFIFEFCGLLDGFGVSKFTLKYRLKGE